MDKTQALLFLDTDDKIIQGGKLNNCEVSFPVNFKSNTVSRAALASYDFVTNFDNVNESNYISVIEDSTATSYPVQIATGKYTGSTLAAAIQNSLNTLALGVFSVSWVDDNHFELSSPLPIFFRSNPITGGNKDWADMIGMPKDSGFGTLFIGGAVDLTYTNKLYIVCDDIHRFKLVSDESSNRKLINVLGVVYLHENQIINDDIIIQKHSTARLPWLKWIKHKVYTELGPLNISIRDDRGDKIVDSQIGNIKWSLELYTEEGGIS